MNPPSFNGSMVYEVPQEFIDEVSKIPLAIGLSLCDKAEFATYQLKDVAQSLYVEWSNNYIEGWSGDFGDH